MLYDCGNVIRARYTKLPALTPSHKALVSTRSLNKVSTRDEIKAIRNCRLVLKTGNSSICLEIN